MCESSAYLQGKDGKEELLIEDVVMLKPEDGRIVLMNILGEKKEIDAGIDHIDLLRHKILLRRP